MYSNFLKVVLNHNILKSPIEYDLSYFLQNFCLLNHFLLNIFANIKLNNRLKCFKKIIQKLFESFSKFLGNLYNVLYK